MSGGGASIINLPVFLALGMPFPLAVAVQKVSSAFWVLPAAYNYLRGQVIQWRFLLVYACVGLVGAYLGVLFVLEVNQRFLEVGIGVLIVLLVVYTYFNKGLGLTVRPVLAHHRIKELGTYASSLVLGFYESIFGSGNGILFSLISVYTKGLDFVSALGYYFAIAFAWVVFAATLLIYKGYYDFSFMIPAVLGGVLGAWCGSKLGKFKGNHFIKVIFVLVAAVLGLKLILGV
jgi:uncharacterized membrane protein YfcA